jgi:hypothetical protein
MVSFQQGPPPQPSIPREDKDIPSTLTTFGICMNMIQTIQQIEIAEISRRRSYLHGSVLYSLILHPLHLHLPSFINPSKNHHHYLPSQLLQLPNQLHLNPKEIQTSLPYQPKSLSNNPHHPSSHTSLPLSSPSLHLTFQLNNNS